MNQIQRARLKSNVSIMLYAMVWTLWFLVGWLVADWIRAAW